MFTLLLIPCHAFLVFVLWQCTKYDQCWSYAMYLVSRTTCPNLDWLTPTSVGRLLLLNKKLSYTELKRNDCNDQKWEICEHTQYGRVDTQYFSSASMRLKTRRWFWQHTLFAIHVMLPHLKECRAECSWIDIFRHILFLVLAQKNRPQSRKCDFITALSAYQSTV